MSNPSRERTEQALVKAAQAGDQDALDRLIGGYIDTVTALVRRKVPREDVDDVAQEVLLALIEMLPHLNNPAAFRGSARTITRRRIADYHRHSDPVICSTVDAGIDVEGQRSLESVEDRISTEELIGEMSRCSRVILRLHIERGWSFAEVGKRLGISEGATRIRFYRARSRIRQVGM